MLSHIVFENDGPRKLALLIKNNAMQKKELEEHYVKPLEARGFSRSDILVLSLEYNQNNKAPARLMEGHLAVIGKVLEQQGIDHVLVADAGYFKKICKVRKAEPHFGYVLPTIWPGVQAALTINYTQLFHNPALKDRLMFGVRAIAKEMQGDLPIFFEKVIKDVSYPSSVAGIEKTLDRMLQYPALTCDIETMGLTLQKSQIASIAFAWDQHSGTSFLVNLSTEHEDIHELLRQFFRLYQGKLIFHNAPFDTKALTYQLFMKNIEDMKGMLRGLEYLYRDTDDTMTLTYLATNNTSENKLSLKDQAFEFTGNYALNEIANVDKVAANDLLQYNVTDALATWYVYNKHRETVRKEQEKVYQELFRPALKVLTQMELCGMPLDMVDVSLTREKLYGILNAEKEAIANSKVIKQFESELKISSMLDANRKLKKKVKKIEEFDWVTFNPRSAKQLRHLLYDWLHLPVFRYTDTNLPSTDGKTLDSLIAHLKREYDL